MEAWRKLKLALRGDKPNSPSQSRSAIPDQRVEAVATPAGPLTEHSGPHSNTHPPRTEYPVFPPASPEAIISSRDAYIDSIRRRAFITPEGHPADTPLFALYRIYEYVILFDNIGLRSELEKFWFRRWPVSSIPDPADAECPTRYAALAGVAAMIARSFNWRIEKGFARWLPAIIADEDWDKAQNEPKVYEEVPEWCEKVSRLEETLVLPYVNWEDKKIVVLEKGFEDERHNKQMAAKNILSRGMDIFFV